MTTTATATQTMTEEEIKAALPMTHIRHEIQRRLDEGADPEEMQDPDYFVDLLLDVFAQEAETVKKIMNLDEIDREEIARAFFKTAAARAQA